LLSEAERIQRLAEADGKYHTAMDALKRAGRSTGIRIERQEIGTVNEFAAIEAMSRAELIEFITRTLESGELALDHKPGSDQGNECV
jgi:hypothetical protein